MSQEVQCEGASHRRLLRIDILYEQPYGSYRMSIPPDATLPPRKLDRRAFGNA